MADDLGWGEVGLYPAQSKHGRIRTPHLDAFGREGMVFLHAYAGYCVCAPSRMSFFTGRHSGRFAAMRVNGRSLPVAQNISVFPQVLQRAGYATGAFGKIAPLDSPLQQGFSIFIGQKHQGLCHNMYPKHIDREAGSLNLPLSGNFQNKSRELCMKNPEKYNYTIDVFQDAAIAWLTKVSKGTAPFFLYMSYTIPHAGGWGDFPKWPESGQPVPYDMGYGHKDWPEVERDHAAVISYMDMKIGELMEQLKSLGIDNNTICLLVKSGFMGEREYGRRGFTVQGVDGTCEVWLVLVPKDKPIEKNSWPSHVLPRAWKVLIKIMLSKSFSPGQCWLVWISEWLDPYDMGFEFVWTSFRLLCLRQRCTFWGRTSDAVLWLYWRLARTQSWHVWGQRAVPKHGAVARAYPERVELRFALGILGCVSNFGAFSTSGNSIPVGRYKYFTRVTRVEHVQRIGFGWQRWLALFLLYLGGRWWPLCSDQTI